MFDRCAAFRVPLNALAVVASTGVILLVITTLVRGQPADASGHLALVGGTIYSHPAEDPIPNGVVLVEDGRIVAVGSRATVEVPPNTETLDCTGLTITAGFWNSHVHFMQRKWVNVGEMPALELQRQLQEMVTRYGFTSVFDLASQSTNTRRLRDRIESGEVAGPRILTTGEALVAPGAAPPESVLEALGYMTVSNHEIANAATARTAARRLLNGGADGIKVHLQPPPAPRPPFPEDGILEAVREADRADKPVFVHPSSGADVVVAARAGVDVIAHTTPLSGPWDDTMLAAMTEEGVALIPTLTVWKSLLRHDRLSRQERAVNTAVGQLRAWFRSGGTVLFGNDLGAVDYDPSEEYFLMAAAGMSFRQLLASLTTAPAAQFGESGQLGQVAVGLIADLAIFDGDPLSDLGALSNVQYTLRDGQIIYAAP